MACLVCDRTPCDNMRNAINVLATSTYEKEQFSFMVRAQIDHRIYFLVPLKYCPFCGTRIDPQWVRNFYGIQPAVVRSA